MSPEEAITTKIKNQVVLRANQGIKVNSEQQKSTDQCAAAKTHSIKSFRKRIILDQKPWSSCNLFNKWHMSDYTLKWLCTREAKNICTHCLSQFHSRFFGLESSPLQPQVLDLCSCPQVEQRGGLAEEEGWTYETHITALFPSLLHNFVLVQLIGYMKLEELFTALSHLCKLKNKNNWGLGMRLAHKLLLSMVKWCTFWGVGSERHSTFPGRGVSPSKTSSTRLTSGIFEEAGLIETVMAERRERGRVEGGIKGGVYLW